MKSHIRRKQNIVYKRDENDENDFSAILMTLVILKY